MAKTAAASSSATKVAVTLRGREYFVSCDTGEELRLKEIVRQVESTLNEAAAKSSSASEARLFMLACLLLADELIETRRIASRTTRAEEDIMVAAVEHLRQRVATIAQQVGRA
ncbi:MAG: cell division protein ZapA [Alphaproteobacteria bacterium]|nr:cell division protein ZapA [Alphaproteobacteria bacterium]